MTAVARISRSALSHNLRVLAKRSSPAHVMFVVKANGYGHGDVAVSSIASSAGIRHFGCLEIETARRVRDALGESDSMVLAWQFSDHDALDIVVDGNIDVGVGSFDQLRILEKSHEVGKPFRIHIKVDTGLNRNGVRQSDWPEFVSHVAELESQGVVTVTGVWTHIAETDDDSDTRAHTDFSAARALAEGVLGRPLFSHLAASSASFRLPEFRFDAVRIGGHAYGIPSFDGVTPENMGLIPVMSLEAPARREIHPLLGDVIVVDAGFSDGVPGYASGRVAITVSGQRCAIREVAEDHLIAEYRDGADGNLAVLFGSGASGEQTVREWGDALDTLGDEITCRVSPTVERHYVD